MASERAACGLKRLNQKAPHMPTPFAYQIYMNTVQCYTKEVQIEPTCSVTQSESLHFERFRDFIVVTDILCLEAMLKGVGGKKEVKTGN